MRLEKAINPLLDDNDQVALSFIFDTILQQIKATENVSSRFLGNAGYLIISQLHGCKFSGICLKFSFFVTNNTMFYY